MKRANLQVRLNLLPSLCIGLAPGIKYNLSNTTAGAATFNQVTCMTFSRMTSWKGDIKQKDFQRSDIKHIKALRYLAE